MIQNKYVAFGLFVVAIIVFWNLAGLLSEMMFSGGGYHFGKKELGMPLVIGIVSGYFLYLKK